MFGDFDFEISKISQDGACTHRCGDVDEKGVAVNTHSLQERVTSNLPLGPLSPRQETPQTNRHQPGVHEDHDCRYCNCHYAGEKGLY